MQTRNVIAVVVLFGLLLTLGGSVTGASASDVTLSNSGPYVDKIVYKVMYDQNERINALLAGQIEMDAFFFDPVYLPTLDADPDIDIFGALRNGYGHITINCRDYPLNIPELRRAFAFSFDKTAVTTDVLGGFSQEHDSLVPYVNGWCIEDDMPYHYYTDQSTIGNQLLDDAGFTFDTNTGFRLAPNGEPFDIVLEYASSSPSIAGGVAQIGVDALLRLGIDARAEARDFNDYISRLDIHADYDMVFYAVNFGSNDVDWLAYEYWSEFADVDAQNPSNFANATYDSWRDQLLYGTTYEEVYEAAAEMQKILQYNVPRLIVYENIYLQGYRNDVFTGHVEDLGRYISGPWTTRKIQKIDGTLGGTVPIAINQEPGSFNIYKATAQPSISFFDNIYSSLFKYSSDLTPCPELAEDLVIETHSDNPSVPDGHTRYTFDIIQNATWSDGRQLSARDVAFTINYMREHGYGELDELFAAYAPTDYTFVAEFIEESYWFFSKIAYSHVIPQHIWKDIDAPESYSPNYDELVTSGPFYISDYVPGDFYELTKNPYFFYPADTVNPIENPPVPPTPSFSLDDTDSEDTLAYEILNNYEDILDGQIAEDEKIDPFLQAYIDEGTISEDIVTNNEDEVKIILYFDPSSPTSEIDPFMDIEWSVDLGVIGIVYGTVESPTDIQTLSEQDTVRYLSADRVFHSNDVEADSNGFEDEWNMFDVTDIRKIVKAEEASNLGYDGTGVVIGIDDNGVDFSTHDLQDAMAVDSEGYPLSYDPTGYGLQFMNLANSSPVSDVDSWLASGNVLTYEMDGKYFLNVTNWDPVCNNQGGTRALLGLPAPYGDWDGEDFSYFGFIGGYEQAWGVPSFSEFVYNEMWHDWEIPAPTSEDYRVGWVFEQRMDPYMKVFAPALITDKTNLIIDWNGSLAWTEMWNHAAYYEYIDLSNPDDRNSITSMMDWSFVDDISEDYVFTVNGKNILSADVNDDDLIDWGLGSFTWCYDSEDYYDEELFCGITSDAMGFALMYPSDSNHGHLVANAIASRGVLEYDIHGDGVMHTLPGIATGSKLISVKSMSSGSRIGALLWSAGFHLDEYLLSWVYTGEHRADLVCNSWTYNTGSSLDLTFLSFLYDLVSSPGLIDAQFPGILYICSSGNSGSDYMTSSSPATSASVVSVGGTNWRYTEEDGFMNYGEIDYYSSNGPSFVGLVKPDVVAIAYLGISSLPLHSKIGIGDNFQWWAGTSFSCALAAGVTGIIQQALIENGYSYDPVILREILLSSSEDLGYDAFLQGHGHINAMNAVASITSHATDQYYFHSPDSVTCYSETIQDAWDASMPGSYYYGYFIDESLESYSGTTGMSSLFFGNVHPDDQKEILLSANGYDGVSNPLATYETVDPWYYRKASVSTIEVDTYTYSDPRYPSDPVSAGFYNLTELMGSEFIDNFLNSHYATITISFDSSHEGAIDARMFDWEDRDENGLLTFWSNELGTGDYSARINRDYSQGNVLVLRVADPHLLSNKFDYTPTITLSDSAAIEYGGSTTVTISIILWEKVIDSRISITQSTGTEISATLNIPSDAEHGIQNGFIHVVDDDSGYSHQIPYSYMVVRDISGPEGSIHTLVDTYGEELTPYENGALIGSHVMNGDTIMDGGGYRTFLLNITDPSATVLVMRAEWQNYGTIVDMYLRKTSSEIVTSTNYGLSTYSFYPVSTADLKNVIAHAPGESISGTYYLSVCAHQIDGSVIPENITVTLQWFTVLPEPELTATYTTNYDATPIQFGSSDAISGDHVVITTDWSFTSDPIFPETAITETEMEIFSGRYEEVTGIIAEPNADIWPVDLELTEHYTTHIFEDIHAGETVRCGLRMDPYSNDPAFGVYEWIDGEFGEELLLEDIGGINFDEYANFVAPYDMDIVVVVFAFLYSYIPGTYTFTLDTQASVIVSDVGSSVSYDTYYFAPEANAYYQVHASAELDIELRAYTDSNLVFSTSINDVEVTNFFVPEVTVVYPNGGEILTDTVSIAWTMSDYNMYETHISEVFVSNDGGMTYMLLATNLDTESWQWDASGWQILDSYMVLVRTSDGGLWGYDTSDGMFTAGDIPVIDTRFPNILGIDEFTILDLFGNYVTWTVHDIYPGSYEIWVDDSLAFEEIWSSNEISFNCDGLTIGVHNFTIRVFDLYDNYATFTTWVTQPDFSSYFNPPEYLEFNYMNDIWGIAESLVYGQSSLGSGYIDYWSLDHLIENIDYDQFNLIDFPRNGYGLLSINCDKYPYSLTSFRRALAFAIDKTRICNEFDTFSITPYDSFIPEVNQFSNEDELPYHYYDADLITGNQLLDEAGFLDINFDGIREAPNHEEFTVIIEVADIVENIENLGNAAVDALQGLHIDAELRLLGYWDYMTRVQNHEDYDIAFFGTSYDDFELDSLVYEYHSENVETFDHNLPNWINSTYDMLADTILSSSDYQEIVDTSVQIQEVWLYECPQIILYHQTRTNAIEKGIHDYYLSPVSGATNYDTYLQMISYLPVSNPLTSAVIGPVTTNPFLVSQWYSYNEFNPLSLIYEGLARENVSGSMVSALASSWALESDGVSADILINLESDVVWHDLASVTSADVAFTYEYMKTHDIPIFRDALSAIDSVEITDSLNLRIHMNTQSYWDMIEILKIPILPSHIWDVISNPYEISNSEPIGSGPFMYSSSDFTNVFGHPVFEFLNDALITANHPEQTVFRTVEDGDHLFGINYVSGELPLEYSITVSYDGNEEIYYGTITESDVVERWDYPVYAGNVEGLQYIPLPIHTDVSVVVQWDTSADLDISLWTPSTIHADALDTLELQRWHDYYNSPHELKSLETYVSISPSWASTTDFSVYWRANGPYDVTDATVYWAYSSNNVAWTSWELLGEFTPLSTYGSGYVDFTATNGEGYYTFMIEANDVIGHYNSFEFYTGVDFQTPVADAGQDWIIQQWDYFTFDSSDSYDNIQIASYEWSFYDEGDIYLWGPNPTYQFTHEGVFTVMLTVTDYAGHQSVDYMSITAVYDVAPPDTTVTGPPSGSSVSGDTTYTIESEDETGVEQTDVYLDGELVLSVQSSVVDYVLDPTTIADGEHTLEIKVYDTFGQESVTVYVVFTDTDPPDFWVDIPETPDEPFYCEPVIPDTDIERVEFWLDDVLVVTDYTDPYVFYVHTPSLADGPHTLTIIVYDEAGNQAVEVNIFVVDNTPPEVIVTGITEGETVTGFIDIAADVTDFSQINRVEYYIDWVLVFTDYDVPYLYSLDTTGLSDGEHMLSVKAYDQYGNERLVQIGFFVDNSPPELLDFYQDFFNGIPGWDLSFSATLADPGSITSVNAVIHLGTGYSISITMTPAGAGLYEAIWSSPTTLIGEYTIDIVATDALGNTGTYTNVGWVHLYDYIKLTATRAELELVDDWGSVLNRSWNDFYDTNGLPMAYFNDDGGSVELLILNPTSELYHVTVTYLDTSDYTLHVLATSDGSVVYDESYVNIPMTTGDIHEYLVSSTELSTEIRNDTFDDNDISEWTVTRGSFVATDGYMTGETAIWNWAYIDSTMTCGTWSFDVFYAGLDGFNVWFMTNELVAPDYYNPREGYFIHVSEYTGGAIQLIRDLDRQQIVLDSYTPVGGLDGWWSISVTRNANGEFEVYVNDILVMQVQDTTFVESSWFAFETFNTQSIDNITFVESSRVVDSEALPEVLAVVATDSLYVVPGDYVYCQLSWLNIDPGAAENAQLYVTFSEYLEFVDSSVPVIIDGDSFIFEIGLIQGFSIEDIEITFLANLLATDGTELWINATLSYNDEWTLYSFESRDRQMVTVVTELPDNEVHKSSWWKKEFSYVLNDKSATYNRAYLETLVIMISHSSELFSDVTTLESALSILLEDIDGHLGKAMGELYAVWLNLANDALTADTEIDLSDLTTAGTVGEALIECEAILLDSSSSDDDYKNVDKICENINAGKY